MSRSSPAWPGLRTRIALFDAGVVLAGITAVMLWQAGTLDGLMPVVGTHGGSLAAGIFFINAANGLYAPAHRGSAVTTALRTMLALLLALALTYGMFTLLPSAVSGRGDVLLLAMGVVSAVVLRRAYVNYFVHSPTRRRTRTLIFGSGEPARVVGQTLTRADPDLHLVGFLPGPNEREPAVGEHLLLPSSRSLIQTAADLEVDEIVVALSERRAGSMPLRELLDCKLQGIKVYDINSHFEKRLGQIRIEYLQASWLIFGDGFNQGLARTSVKRLFDLVCAGALVALSSPVMLLAALAIKLDSRGPVLYRQERVGLNNRPFQVVKFRSMRTDAEKDGRAIWATHNDDRVTRVGRFIRLTRIDELPQLFSVLKGDMSLVGPRPERPIFVEQLTQQIPFYAVRHSVKPGVTGWAQVRYQYGATVEDSQNKLQYDLHYVKNHSLCMDLQILCETVHVVLTGKGAR
jgi:sugar transferase (PEP-CTERM system associated)